LLPRTVKCLRPALEILCLLLIRNTGLGQDLDPRAYARVPVDATILISGFSYSDGGIVTDVTLPLENGLATVETPSIGLGRTFSLFGQTAQAFGTVSYAWAQLSAELQGQGGSTNRSGFNDMRFRISMLFCGAPAAGVQEFAKAPRQTILGTSVTVVAPIGQYSAENVVNLGANRWAFKPEVALSQPLGERWLFDMYAAVWLFTTNTAFYPGSSNCNQDPLLSFQAHISLNVQPTMWVAFDMTYYTGGQSFVNGVPVDNRQNNLRIGGTLVLPVGNRHSVKIAASTGAVIRFGADFTTLSIGWQTTFF
jgi:hypothetical protein